MFYENTPPLEFWFSNIWSPYIAKSKPVHDGIIVYNEAFMTKKVVRI